MSETTDWKLIARYLSNQCSSEDKEKVEYWVNSDPENKRLMKLMKVVWDTPEILPQESDVKSLWTATARRAGISPKFAGQEADITPPPDSAATKIPFFIPFHKYRVLRYATILLLIILIPYFIWKATGIFSPEKQALELTEISVGQKKQTDIALSDGTRVTLDAGSLFQYPTEFTGKTREVFLAGEGYFNVAPDKKRPFIVHANNAVIKVLGTRFNVRAWQHNRRVRVTVAEGKVSLRSEKAADEEAVVILEGQLSTLPEKGRPSEPGNVDVRKHLGWINREVFFEDTPFHEILYQLERWYDLRFILEDDTIASDRLTVYIQNKPIEDILELITTLTKQKYERLDSTVILKPKKNES
jgi:ferric-dicitrate binding protein FerR (iron transport regulator)